MFFDTEFSIIALIGIFPLIGIVKKNAIMMIDLRSPPNERGMARATPSSRPAALPAIMMTTMRPCSARAAGARLAPGPSCDSRSDSQSSAGALSQMLTLYTTPVIYLYTDRLVSSHRRHAVSPLAITTKRMRE